MIKFDPDDLLKEYTDVLTREKFFKYRNAKILPSDIEKYAVKYYPVINLNIIGDCSDNKLPELAGICHAKYLITGNSNDFQWVNTGKQE